MKKRIALLLLFLFVFSGCSAGRDFSFIIRWGVGRGSVYNSATGLLVKAEQASEPDRFRTVLKLKREESAELSALADAIDLTLIPEIPETYDMYSPPGVECGLREKPPMLIELTLRTDREEKHIRCVNVNSLFSVSEETEGDPVKPFDENGKALEAFLRRALEIILDSEEWLALPPSEAAYQ